MLSTYLNSEMIIIKTIQIIPRHDTTIVLHYYFYNFVGSEREPSSY